MAANELRSGIRQELLGAAITASDHACAVDCKVTKPNAAFVFDREGHLAFRSLWASDESGLRSALFSIRDKQALKARQSRRMVGPMLQAIGYVAEAMTRGGRRSHRDLLVAMPPMEIAGLLANAFKPLPRGLRGPAAVMTMLGLAVALVAGLAFAF